MFQAVSRQLRFSIVLSLGMAFPSPGIATEAGVEKILQCMRANVPDSVVAQELKLDSVNRLDEVSSYELQVYARRNDEQFEMSALIRQPLSLANGAYLLKADAVRYLLYMYVPSLDKVRRITGEGVTRSSLLGTDLSWEDLQLMYSAHKQGTVNLQGQAEYKGRTIEQLAITPDPEAASAYSRIEMDIDSKTCVPLEIRLMGQANELHKRLTIDSDSLQQINKRYWYASRMRLDDVREKTHTNLEVQRELVADEKIRSQLFSPRLFYKAR